MSDPSDVYDLYLRRRKKFIDELALDPHKDIRKKYYHALVNTDLCWQIYGELPEYTKKMLIWIAKEDKENAERDAKIKSLLDNVDGFTDSMADESQRDTQEAFRLQLHALDLLRQQLALNLQRFHGFFLEFNAEILIGSLSRFFRADTSQEMAEAVSNAAKLLIPFIPFFGPAADTIRSFVEWLTGTINKRKETLYTASQLLEELDSYNFYAFCWCQVAQLFYDTIDATVIGSNEASLKDSTQKVQKRFLAIIEKRMQDMLVDDKDQES